MFYYSIICIVLIIDNIIYINLIIEVIEVKL